MHSLSYINGLHKLSSSNSMSAPGGQNPSALLSFIVSTFELMYINILVDQNVYFGTSDASQKLTLFSLLLNLSPSFHLLLRLTGMRVYVIGHYCSLHDFTCWFCITPANKVFTLLHIVPGCAWLSPERTSADGQENCKNGLVTPTCTMRQE